MRNNALIAVALVLLVSRPGWSQRQDLSGAWATTDSEVTVLRQVHITPGGWGQFAGEPGSLWPFGHDRPYQ